MCGAFVYVHPEDHPDRLEAGFNWSAVVSNLIDQRPDLRSRFNIRPTQDVVIVVNESGRLSRSQCVGGLFPIGLKMKKCREILSTPGVIGLRNLQPGDTR
ncbi:MAG: hypothetical protein CM1200mP39_30290 [Dehalococcoidia bacterium]|nr:MAG: hypothetical protein CM1200mP39_30290 [Dehalococcoidia bacterium]